MIDPRFTDPETLQVPDDCSQSRRWIVAALAGVFALAVGMGLKAAGVWG